MGQFIKISSPESHLPKRKSLISSSSICISRANLKFVHKILSYNQESIIWLANNIQNDNERFFVKQSHKYTLYNNKRIDAISNQLRIYKILPLDQFYTDYANQMLFAFQDYQYLYLVSHFIDGYSFETVLRQHVFTEEETKYIMMLMIDMIDYLHSHGYIASEISPSNFMIERKTGRLKLIQLTNPLKMDQYYPSSMVTHPSIWSAPEILLKDRVLGQSDYYSLGLIMYQMMTQKQPISQQLFANTVNNTQNCGLTRNFIVEQQITVTKSDVPEGWNPEAADFLIKLLIKNPNLRLGRFGSFQVRNHPWLQNYNNWRLLGKITQSKGNSLLSPSQQNSATDINFKSNNYNLSNSGGITLNEQYFIEKNIISNLQHSNLNSNSIFQINEQESKDLIKKYSFQMLFEQYEYNRLSFDPQYIKTRLQYQ